MKVINAISVTAFKCIHTRIMKSLPAMMIFLLPAGISLKFKILWLSGS
jgi:hypothetical protein